MSTLVDSLVTRYSNRGMYPGKVRASVSYSISHGRRAKVHDYSYDMDFDIFYGSHFVGHKSLDDLVAAVDNIQKALRSWTLQGNAKVLVRDYDEFAQQERGRIFQLNLARKVEELRNLQGRKEGNGKPLI